MPDAREYPDSPLPAVGAVVRREDRILMVKRGQPPHAGLWSVPGGAVEEGETVEEAAVREAHEECSVEVGPIQVIHMSDLIERDDRGLVRFHYVLIDVECRYVSGEVVPGSDADNAAWIPLRELHEYDVSETTLTAIETLLGRRRP